MIFFRSLGKYHLRELDMYFNYSLVGRRHAKLYIYLMHN